MSHQRREACRKACWKLLSLLALSAAPMVRAADDASSVALDADTYGRAAAEGAASGGAGRDDTGVSSVPEVLVEGARPNLLNVLARRKLNLVRRRFLSVWDLQSQLIARECGLRLRLQS